jgi:hypothetical protein
MINASASEQTARRRMRTCGGRRLVIGLAAALLAAIPAQAETSERAQLPPAALPAGLSVYLEASVTGEDTYTCLRTDAMQWAWHRTKSKGTLSDGRKRPLGSYESRIAIVAPRMFIETSWQDLRGRKVVADLKESGPVPGDNSRDWRRFDVKSHTGAGGVAAAKSVIRISTTWAVRPATLCNRFRADAVAWGPYRGTDLFLK